MPGLLLIAHAPLATALKVVAEHTFPHCAAQLTVLDVTPDMSADDVEGAARALLQAAGHAEALILTDVFGATPCNGAQRLHSETVRVVSGVNVPMLWRSLCYISEPLASLIARAVQGGAAGIMLNDIPVNPNSET
ncbi:MULTISPECIES: PTS sugar transporter subunit IIA [Roseateles]|uniref:PTS fructose transporter subunit IIA n=1 Tax=Roseateles albus TaxID=2987525 RepID=A0ABT5KL08_9BURK|nr:MULTISPECIES: PTS fructose transporter subunit IIA [Roseateles]MCV2360529.1 PTS fructose transporter subunit IIA [Paucibacter sp. TC2R-5]MDC8774546.1 PTS fructose transporter subunit IIA [Roseateles albus]